MKAIDAPSGEKSGAPRKPSDFVIFERLSVEAVQAAGSRQGRAAACNASYVPSGDSATFELNVGTITVSFGQIDRQP